MLNKDQDHFSVAEPPKGAGPSARLLVCLDSYLKAKTEARRNAQIVLHFTTRRRNLTKVRKQIVHFAEPQAHVFSGSYIEASSCGHRERVPRSGDAETGPARRVGHAEKTLRERRNPSIARQVDSGAEQVGSETGIKSVHVVPAEVSDNPEPTLGIEGHGCRASVNVEVR